jgi:hypothetical protein
MPPRCNGLARLFPKQKALGSIPSGGTSPVCLRRGETKLKLTRTHMTAEKSSAKLWDKEKSLSYPT